MSKKGNNIYESKCGPGKPSPACRHSRTLCARTNLAAHVGRMMPGLSQIEQISSATSVLEGLDINVVPFVNGCYGFMVK